MFGRNYIEFQNFNSEKVFVKAEIKFIDPDHIMVMAKKYEMVLAGLPLFVQKIMRTILSPIGKILGYKDYYPEFSSQ